MVSSRPHGRGVARPTPRISPSSSVWLNVRAKEGTKPLAGYLGCLAVALPRQVKAAVSSRKAKHLENLPDEIALLSRRQIIDTAHDLVFADL